jgi:uncharacterized protein (TIGR00730 family)
MPDVANFAKQTCDKPNPYPSPILCHMRIAVYCSSSLAIDPKYIDLAHSLGAGIAARSWELVSGGGHISAMGAVSRGAREAGGKTIGVIPQRLVDIEFADKECDELHIVDSMRNRKALIEDLADAFIALPGGIGTLEELFEIWVGRFLKFHNKPVIILDPYDLYAPLATLIDHLEEHGFVKPGQRELLHWAKSIDQGLDMATNFQVRKI